MTQRTSTPTVKLISTCCTHTARRASLALVLALLLGPSLAGADTATWLGTTTNYNLTTNWVGTPASVPGNGVAGETAFFTDTGAGAVNLGAATTHAVGLDFNSNSTYTLTVGAGVQQGLTAITTNDVNGVILSSTGSGVYTLAPGSHAVNTTNGSAGVLINGVVTGAGSLEKLGPGTLQLLGNNTYSGGTTLTGGILEVRNNQALGSGTLYLNGGSLSTSGGHTLSNNIVQTAPSTITGGDNLSLSGRIDLGAFALTNTNDTTLTLSGAISGSGSIISTPNAFGTTLVLSGNNTYSGGTTVAGGTLVVSGVSPLGAASGGLTIKPGPGIPINNLQAGTGGATLANQITANDTVNITGGNDLTLNGALALGGHPLVISNTAATIVGGNITGSGNLDFTGGAGGILTLAGADNSGYSGTTTLNSGTLLAGSNSALGTGGLTVNGGTLGAGAPGITLNNAVAVGGSFSLGTGAGYGLILTSNLALGAHNLTQTGAGTDTLTGNLSGTGAVAVNAGTLVLAGINNYSGGTTVSGGTLIVNGSVAGDVTNNAAGLVKGSGTIGGALINSGTVNPGNSPGTLTVGSYTANAGSNTVIEVASASNYDRLLATNAGAGSIALNPGSILTPTLVNGFIPKANQVFAGVLQATGAGGRVTGTFSSIANQRISRILSWQAIYNPASVDLKAQANFLAPDLNLNANQLSVANLLQNFSTLTSGDLYDVLNALCTLQTNDQVQAAYNEISPLKYAGLPVATFGLTRMQNQMLLNRLARLRWEAELADGGALAARGGLFGGLNFSYENKMLMASTNLTASDAGTPMLRRKPLESRWGLYLEPLVNWGQINGDFNNAGYRSVSAGFAAGVDFWVTENFLVGLNTGYYNTDAQISGSGGNVNINTIPVNAYGSFSRKGFYVNGLVGYTHNGYDNSRNISFGTLNRVAKSGTDGNQFQLAAETGYDLKAGNAIFGPTLSLQYATANVNGFTETGANSLNLAVGSQSASSVQTGLGARASYRAKLGNTIVKPQVSAVWQHEYADNNRGLNASLATVGGGTMTYRTTRTPGQDFCVVNANVSARFSQRLTANVGYTGELGRSNAANHALTAGLRFEF